MMKVTTNADEPAAMDVAPSKEKDPNNTSVLTAQTESTTDVFDPFGLGEEEQDDTSSTQSPKPPPVLQRVALFESLSKQAPPFPRKISPPLPPRITVKFSLHEEVSSMTLPSSNGTSEVSVDGTVYAQVQSSDAKKNIPFLISGRNSHGDHVLFQGNNKYVLGGGERTETMVQIDKSEIASVEIGRYSITETIQHMPVLVESKVSVHGNVCRVAVQFRSKLTNQGDLEDFTIAVAVPERVNASTVKVVHGEGVFEDLKRTIKWRVAKLPKGSSFLVAARAELWSPVPAGDKQSVRFPVLVRCTSTSDLISSVEFKAMEAEGHPATFSTSSTHSFRLLHRLT